MTASSAIFPGTRGLLDFLLEMSTLCHSLSPKPLSKAHKSEQTNKLSYFGNSSHIIFYRLSTFKDRTLNSYKLYKNHDFMNMVIQ